MSTLQIDFFASLQVEVEDMEFLPV